MLTSVDPLPEGYPQSLSTIAEAIKANGALNFDYSVMKVEPWDVIKAVLLRENTLISSCNVTRKDTSALIFTGTIEDLTPLFPAGQIKVTGCLMDVPVDYQTAPERHCFLLLERSEGLDLISFLGAYNESPNLLSGFLSGGADALTKYLRFSQGRVLFSSLDFSWSRYANVVLPPEIGMFMDSTFMATQDVRAGLNFRIEGEWEDGFASVLQLLKIPSTISWHSHILISCGDIDLRVGTGILSPAVGFPTDSPKFTLQLTDLQIQFALDKLGQEIPQVSLLGRMTIPNSFILDVEVGLDLTARRLSLNFRSEFELPSLSDLASLVGESDLMGRLPENTAGSYGKFCMSTLSVALGLNPVSLDFIGFEIAAEKPVVLVDGIISVIPGLSLQVFNPFDSSNRSVNVDLYGRWFLGKTAFDVLLSLEDKSIHAQMAIGHSLDMAALIEKIIPGVNIPASLVLMDMDISANFKDMSFEAEIDVATDWEFEVAGFKFAISELGMEVAYADKMITDCTMKGRVMLLDIEFEVMAVYERYAGWTIRGATVPKETIRFDTIFGKLRENLSQMGEDIPDILDIPDEFEGLYVSDLFFEYHFKSKQFTFFTTLNHIINIPNEDFEKPI